jgi:serine/threonine-protein kinase
LRENIPTSDEGEDRVGRIVDDLAIVSLIGSGATGKVYQAIEKDAGSRMVAVKFMNATEQSLRKTVLGDGNPFDRDLQFSRVVEDPRVARIYRVDQDLQGSYYEVMELVEGISLAQELEYRGLLPWKEAVELAVEISRGVGAFHRLNIIHRDIAPGNVMTKIRRDGRPRVKLIDFGLAKLGHESDDDGSPLFVAAMGTPQYLAPEQALGRGSTRRSDVYSIGAILYHMLSGKPVLSLKRPSSHACVEYLKAGRPIPSIALSELAPASTPPALVRFVNRCLSIDASMRPPDADAVADECEKFLSSRKREPKPGRRGAFARLIGRLFRKKDATESTFVRRG